MKPALTPEEWADLDIGDREGDAWIDEAGVLHVVTEGGWCAVIPKRPHALAALALHGQPFGFTREDVWALRTVSISGMHESTEERILRAVFNSLAARIEALLPPEAK